MLPFNDNPKGKCMRFVNLVLFASVLMLTGCASSLMKPAADQKVPAVAADTSRVIFLRPSSFGGAIQASLFDVTSGKPQYIGVSSTNTKLVHDVKPGTYRFMVVSEAADFLEAKLAPGKTYYAVVTARMGMWKARFSLWPVKAAAGNEFQLSNPDLPKWVQDASLVVNTPEGEAWAKANAADINTKFQEYMPVWKQKSADDLKKRTLEEQDGVIAK